MISLHDSLKHFVSAWESTDNQKQTLKELPALLLIEEERLKQSDVAMAFALSETNRKAEGKPPERLKAFSSLGRKSETSKSHTVLRQSEVVLLESRRTVLDTVRFCDKITHISNMIRMMT